MSTQSRAVNLNTCTRAPHTYAAPIYWAISDREAVGARDVLEGFVGGARRDGRTGVCVGVCVWVFVCVCVCVCVGVGVGVGVGVKFGLQQVLESASKCVQERVHASIFAHMRRDVSDSMPRLSLHLHAPTNTRPPPPPPPSPSPPKKAALKVISKDGIDSLARALAEVDLLQGVHHRNIIGIREVGHLFPRARWRPQR